MSQIVFWAMGTIVVFTFMTMLPPLVYILSANGDSDYLNPLHQMYVSQYQ